MKKNRKKFFGFTTLELMISFTIAVIATSIIYNGLNKSKIIEGFDDLQNTGNLKMYTKYLVDDLSTIRPKKDKKVEYLDHYLEDVQVAKRFFAQSGFNNKENVHFSTQLSFLYIHGGENQNSTREFDIAFFTEKEDIDGNIEVINYKYEENFTDNKPNYVLKRKSCFINPSKPLKREVRERLRDRADDVKNTLTNVKDNFVNGLKGVNTSDPEDQKRGIPVLDYVYFSAYDSSNGKSQFSTDILSLKKMFERVTNLNDIEAELETRVAQNFWPLYNQDIVKEENQDEVILFNSSKIALSMQYYVQEQDQVVLKHAPVSHEDFGKIVGFNIVVEEKDDKPVLVLNDPYKTKKRLEEDLYPLSLTLNKFNNDWNKNEPLYLNIGVFNHLLRGQNAGSGVNSQMNTQNSTMTSHGTVIEEVYDIMKFGVEMPELWLLELVAPNLGDNYEQMAKKRYDGVINPIANSITTFFKNLFNRTKSETEEKMASNSNLREHEEEAARLEAEAAAQNASENGSNTQN